MADVIDLQKAANGGVERKGVDVDLSGLTQKVAEMFTPLGVPFLLLTIDPNAEVFGQTSNMYGDAQVILMEKAKFLLLTSLVGGLELKGNKSGSAPDTTEVPQ